MDVSGWTIKQRLRLPDWCFGQKIPFSVIIANFVADTTTWQIQNVALPNEICIWNFFFQALEIDSQSSYVRVGLRETIPTSVEQMDESLPLLPYFSYIGVSPGRIYFAPGSKVHWAFPAKQGFITDGRKLVIEAYCKVSNITVNFGFVYSELPTQMAGWLAHHKV